MYDIFCLEVILLGIIYSADLFDKLKDAGYSTYRLRREKLLSETTMQHIRRNESITIESLSAICEMLNCQPGEILQYVPGNEKAPD